MGLDIESRKATKLLDKNSHSTEQHPIGEHIHQAEITLQIHTYY